MTADRRQMGRRLLAMLADETTIETEPIEDVLADLAAMGIEPSCSIALSRQLAPETVSPATVLLRAVDNSEEREREIERLERSDLADVRAQLPTGTAAGLTARARRSVGDDTAIVGMRQRRSRRMLLGWGGAAAGLAASIILAISLSPGPQVSREVASTSAPASSSAKDEARQLGDITQYEMEFDSVRALPPSAAKREILESPLEGEIMALQTLAAPETRMNVVIATDIATVTALLIVDTRRAPAALRQAAYPEGELLNRLTDARRAAGERPVIALASLKTNQRTYDAVLVERILSQQAQPQSSLPAALEVLLGTTAFELELIELPSP